MKDDIDRYIDADVQFIARRTELKMCIMKCFFMFNRLTYRLDEEKPSTPKELDIAAFIYSHTKKWPKVD